MQTVVPEVSIARAGIARVAVGRLSLGPITVGRLVVGDVRMGVRAGRAELRDVHVTVTLRLRLVWSLHVPLPWPFDDITVAEQSTGLGDVDLPFPFGDAEVPGLRDIDLLIPQLTADGVVTQADPVTGLEVTGVQAEGIHVTDVTLPTAGFQFGGLALTGVSLNDVAVPAASVRGLAVRSVQGPPVRIPSLRLRDLGLPEAAADDIASGPIDLTVDRSDPFRGPRLDLGVLKVQLRVEASARTRMAQMRMSGVRAGASARTVDLRDVTVPYGALELTLSDLGLDVLEVPLVGVS